MVGIFVFCRVSKPTQTFRHLYFTLYSPFCQGFFERNLCFSLKFYNPIFGEKGEFVPISPDFYNFSQTCGKLSYEIVIFFDFRLTNGVVFAIIKA